MPAPRQQTLTRIIPPRRLRRQKVQFNQRNPLDAVYWMPKMSQFTKFVPMGPCGANTFARELAGWDENLPDFHGAKTKLPASIY
jgi:hypothetical protein